ncbi:MAG: hypothetical protein ACO3EL_04825, partial [Burkholderiaceae bacterium]
VLPLPRILLAAEICGFPALPIQLPCLMLPFSFFDGLELLCCDAALIIPASLSRYSYPTTAR